MKEAKFIAGLFFDFDVPKEKAFLLKYFSTPLEKQFIRYLLCFGEFENFVDHTGYYCQMRWLKILKKRFDKLNNLHDKSKLEFDLELLKKIEKGDYEWME